MSAEVLGVKDILEEELAIKYGGALKSVETTFKEALEMFNAADFASRDGWKKESTNPDGDTVFSKATANGKLFALHCEMPGKVQSVFEDNWYGIEEVPKWNPNMKFYKRVVKLTERADILHYGNPDMLIVKGRDFVVGRMHRAIDDGYITVGRSVQLPGIPETKEFVRGELMMGAGRFTPKESDPNVTVIDYVMSIDLKGYIPKAIVNQFMAKLMFNDLSANKKHLGELAAKASGTVTNGTAF